MTCPYLNYQQSDEEHEFENDRPYCTVTDSFVSPMQADICNDRHDFDHTSDCEKFPDDEALPDDGALDGEEALPGDEALDGEEAPPDDGRVPADPSE